jgi:hypothetical protein
MDKPQDLEGSFTVNCVFKIFRTTKSLCFELIVTLNFLINLLYKPNCFMLFDYHYSARHDGYDFEWYIKNGILLDLHHFTLRVEDTVDWKKEELTKEDVLNLLR